MSQRSVFVRVAGNLYREVLNSVPDYEDAVRICRDLGYEKEEEPWEGAYLLVEYEWLEIGAGESGEDTFYDDELLLDLYDTYGYEEIFREQGQEVEVIESGSLEVRYDELEGDCLW